MHSAVTEALGNGRVGEPLTFKNLTLFPLLREGATDAEDTPDYLTLQQALGQKLVEIREVSEAGSVNHLRVTNRAAHAVFILDGEELVGARQNRIVNVSILVPAEQTIVIPVSCVEAGRWYPVSRDFRTSRRTMPLRGRAEKAEHVFASQAMGRGAYADQSAVWADVRRKIQRLHVSTRTEALADVYQEVSPTLGEYEEAFSPRAGQIGVLAAINGRIEALDLFDFPSTLGALFDHFLRGYALESIYAFQEGSKEVSREQAQQFVRQIGEAESQTYPAVGEGEDVRFRGDGLVGSGLVARGRLVHLCAFRRHRDHAYDSPLSRRQAARRNRFGG